MRNISVGSKVFISVLVLFLLNTLLFIVFQQQRERIYKIEMLHMKLQDYNTSLAEELRSQPPGNTEDFLSYYVNMHHMEGLRVTLISPDGTVFFDNQRKDYESLMNHLNRTEVKQALAQGNGYDLNRSSSTLNTNYFYSATYFPEDSVIVRTALPYNSELTKSLRADHRYIWYSVIVFVILVLVLWRFIHRLGKNITSLRLFSSKADHNETLDISTLSDFSSDELGEISEHIIKLFIRLQHTKEEQTVMKRQLTQNIAHELKTPVSSIQGYLETILNTPDITEEQRRLFTERSYAQSQRLVSLLRDISTLNRMDDAPQMIGMETVDVSQMVASLDKEVALQLSEKCMTFNNLLPEDIIIKGNTSLVYSIFRNLLDNAIAYAGEGTTVTLSCEDKTDDSLYHFTFSDNGVGVEPKHLARLFERFYRVDKGRSRKLGGTGLGLAIVKNAILMHGGTISASNNPTGGLRLDFTMKKMS